MSEKLTEQFARHAKYAHDTGDEDSAPPPRAINTYGHFCHENRTAILAALRQYESGALDAAEKALEPLADGIEEFDDPEDGRCLSIRMSALNDTSLAAIRSAIAQINQAKGG